MISQRKKATMRKVFLYMTMTLDGFVAGPNNELDWMVHPVAIGRGKPLFTDRANFARKREDV
jgi:dihydrofolate reductase